MLTLMFRGARTLAIALSMVGLSLRAHAQGDRLYNASACPEGKVLVGGTVTMAAPTGETLRELKGMPYPSADRMIAFRRGIAASYVDQIAFWPWSNLDGPPSIARDISPDHLAAMDDKVLAIDKQSHSWSLDAQGVWQRSARPITDLPRVEYEERLAGADGRWVFTSKFPVPEPEGTATKPDSGAEEAAAPDSRLAILWSDDGNHWQAAKLPEGDWHSTTVQTLVGTKGLWFANAMGPDSNAFGLLSNDGKTWQRCDAAPLAYDWGVYAALDGKVHVLDQHDGNRTNKILSRGLEGGWSGLELPQGAWIDALVVSGNVLLVRGRRMRGEPDVLLPVDQLAKPWKPDLGPAALPSGASLRMGTPSFPLLGLRTHQDSVVAISDTTTDQRARRIMARTEEGAWMCRFDPETNADALLAVPNASASAFRPESPRAGSLSIAIASRGRVRISRDGQAWETYELDGAPELVAVAVGAGQFAALDAAGRLLLSRDGSDWRIATAGTMRFRHLGGASAEILAMTEAWATLSWTAGPHALANLPMLASRRIEPFVRATATMETDLGPIDRPGALHAMDFDGATIAALAGATLLVSRDGEAFERTTPFTSEGKGPLRLALHADNIWITEWGQETQSGTTVPTATVRRMPSRDGDDGAEVKSNNITFDSASDGRFVVFLGGIQKTGYGSACAHWTDDHGATWHVGYPKVKVVPRETNPAGGERSFGSIAVGNGMWMVAGYEDRDDRTRAAVSVSKDLWTWTSHFLPDTVDAPHTLRFWNGRFYAVAQEWNGMAADLLVSEDGVGWTVQRIHSMPDARLAFGRDRAYLHSGEHVLASADAKEWRELVIPALTPQWMMERNGTMFFAAERTLPGQPFPDRIRFVRTPAPSSALLANTSPRLTFAPATRQQLVDDLQQQTERLHYQRLVYALLEQHIAAQRFMTADHAAKLVLAMFAKRRNEHMIFRLTNVIASEEVRKAAKAALTPQEQESLLRYSKAAEGRRGYISETLAKAPSPPPRDRFQEISGLHFDVGAARQRASNGSAGAAFDLSIAYSQGLGVEKNQAYAAQLYSQATAKLGDKPNSRRLADAGSVYGLLESAQSDVKQGNFEGAGDKLWQARSMNGYEAMYVLGQMCLFEGSMAVATVEQAYADLVWAAVTGCHAESMNLLGIAISNGIGVPVDMDVAKQWYELGAAHGSKLAASNVQSLRDRESAMKAMFEGSLATNDVMHDFGDAMADYAGTMQTALEDKEPAASPKHPPGTMLGTTIDGAFQPERFVHFARADGDYRVFVRSFRSWTDRSTTPPTERTIWRWELQLVGITELDRYERSPTAWSRCATCEGRSSVVDGPSKRRVCGTCSGQGFVNSR